MSINFDDIKPGVLVEFLPISNKPLTIKLYPSLESLRYNSYFGYDKVLFVEHRLVSLVIETKKYQFSLIESELGIEGPGSVEAVKVVFDEEAWWIHSFVISKIYDPSEDEEYVT